jgi:probable DNA metabolism protein
MIYLFDESFEGLLSAVFDCFEYKHAVSGLMPLRLAQHSLFDTTHTVNTDPQKSERVWKGIALKLEEQHQRILYCAFLSEHTEVYAALFRVLVRIFRGEATLLQNYGDEDALLIAQTARKVEREKHRMKAFVRFKKSKDGMFFCTIAPDFNVLVLVVSFFRNRYADQPWLIYDERRKYGMYYDTHTVQHVTLMPEEQQALSTAHHEPAQLDDKEALYATLWKDYFKSTNIEARRNLKLHIQHVPRRYWRYLTEKDPRS